MQAAPLVAKAAIIISMILGLFEKYVCRGGERGSLKREQKRTEGGE